MASTIHLPNTNLNQHITFSKMRRPQSHSFGQVYMTQKTETTVSLSSVAAKFAAATETTQTVTTKATISTAIKSCINGNNCRHKLAHLWREIQGSNNWENLVEPLNPFLRQEIIRYGEFVTACYKVFDLDPNSKRYLNCKYGKRNLFREAGMENCGYEVTKYIYATPDINIPIQNGASSNCGRWIGYVAVVNDEDEVKKLGRRDIIITFRGTVTNPEWITNLMSSLTPARLDPHNPRPEVKVESGFLSLYTSDESSKKFGLESCREQLLSEVSRLINKYKGEELSITLTGHSMGSSLALLLAYDIAELGLNKMMMNNNPSSAIPITVFSFGGPRVGNSGFKQRCEELGVKVLRIVNINDPITKMPGVFFNENFRVLFGGGRYEFPGSFSCYAHVGVELVLDFFNMQNPSCVHDLETYINLLKFPNKNLSSQMETRNIIKSTDIVGSDNIINKAKEMFMSHVQNMNMLPWSSVASNLLNLVQYSQNIIC